MGAKIRNAELNKIPIMAILGEQEVNNNSISIRRRFKGDQGSIDVNEFIKLVLDEIVTGFRFNIGGAQKFFNIKGDIKYSFVPSPRLNIQTVNFVDFLNNEKNICEAKEVVLNIPFKHLVSLKKIDFNKINIKDSEININLDEIRNYYHFFKSFNSKSISILNSKINFYSNKKYVASINEAIVEHLTSKLYKKTILEGNFLSDTLNVHLENKLHLSNPFNVLKVINVKLLSFNEL